MKPFDGVELFQEQRAASPQKIRVPTVDDAAPVRQVIGHAMSRLEQPSQLTGKRRQLRAEHHRAVTRASMDEGDSELF